MPLINSRHRQAVSMHTRLCFTVHLYQHHRLKNSFLPQDSHLPRWHWCLQVCQTPTQTCSYKFPITHHLISYASKYCTDGKTRNERKSYRLLWDVTIAGPPRCPVWCRLVTVPTDLVTTFTRPTGPFLSERVVPTPKHPKWRNRTSDHESDGRF